MKIKAVEEHWHDKFIDYLEEQEGMDYQLPQHSIDKAYELLPDYMVGAVIRYFNNHLPPGDFLTAVFSNDLMEAVGRADDINKRYLPEYIMWLYNYAPGRPNGWGSPEAVKAWLMHEEETV